MKKIIYLTLAGGAFLMASCNNGAAPDMAKMNATMDSTANARLEPIMANLKKSCDESIMAAAADSANVMAANAKKGTKVAHHATTHTTKPTPPPAPTKPVLGTGKAGTTNGPAVKLGEGKIGTTNNPAPPAKLGSGKIGTQK